MAPRLILFACLLAAGRLQAGAEAGQPGGYLRAGVGARAAAMGNAYVAVVDGAEAGYWNPAGLAWERRPAFSTMLSSLSLGRQFSYFGLGIAWDRTPTACVQPCAVLPDSGLWGTWALSWLSFSLGNDFEGRQADTATYYAFGDQQNAYLISHGRSLADWWAVGASIKVLDRSLDRYSAQGFGFDVGTQVMLGSKIRLAVQAQDLGTQVTWSTGYRERLPVMLRSSLALWAWRDRILIAGQVEGVEGRQPTFGTGLELAVAGILRGRLGWQQDGLTLGGGLALNLVGLKGFLDYAYLPDPLQQGSAQRISVGISF